MKGIDVEVVWPIQWSEDFAVGIPIVDFQHQKLVTIANHLHSLEGASSRQLERAIEDLMAYVQYHFSMEEHLMAMADFPGLDAHRKEHESLAERVAALWETRHTVSHKQTLDVLTAWVVDHIRDCDQDLKLIATAIGPGW